MKRSAYESGKRMYIVMTIIFALAICGAILFQRFPFEMKLSSGKCVMPYFLHVYCPGCGGTRALTELLNFHFFKSFLCHPLPIYLLALFLHYWISATYTFVFKRDHKMHIKIAHWEYWAILILVICNFVLRNILLMIWGIDYLGDCAAFWHH